MGRTKKEYKIVKKAASVVDCNAKHQAQTEYFRGINATK